MSGQVRLPSIEGAPTPAKVRAADALPYYGGPTPPSGVYRVALRRLYIADNKTRPGMQRVEWVATIDEEDARRSQYNGYVLRDGQNFDRTGLPYMNRMLDAMGLDRRAFHGDGVKFSRKHRGRILSVGGEKVTGLHFYVGTRRRKSRDTGEIELVFAPAAYLDRKDWAGAVRASR